MNHRDPSNQAIELAISQHAIFRLSERIWPALSCELAQQRFLAIVPFAYASAETPAFVSTIKTGTIGYLMFGDAIAMPVIRTGANKGTITTCLTSDLQLRGRRRKDSKNRAARSRRQQSGGGRRSRAILREDRHRRGVLLSQAFEADPYGACLDDVVEELHA